MAPGDLGHLVKATTIAQYVCKELELDVFRVQPYLERILYAYADTTHGK